MRSLALWQNSLLPQVMSPSSLTTSTTRRLPKSSSWTNPATKTRCPRTSLTRNSTMRPSAERYHHHCSFRREENLRTEDKLFTLMKKVCCQPSPSLSCHSRTERPVHELSSLSSCSREKTSRDSENERIRILLERQKEQLLADFRAFANTSLSEEKHYQNKIGNFVKLIWKVFMRCKKLKRFEGSTFDEFSRRRLIEDRDTILELTARIQELQNEVNCMNDSRNF